MRRGIAILAFGLSGMGLAWGLEACGSSSGSMGTGDASKDGTADSRGDAPKGDAGPGPDGGIDTGSEASVTGIEIVPGTDGGTLEGAPGDGIELEVLYKLSDGTTSIVSSSAVTWTSPATVTAQNPDDAGPTSILPEAGAEPTAFFVSNPFRISSSNVLFITDPGTVSSPTITVTASVAKAGTASVKVKVLPAPVGDAVHGQTLFMSLPHSPCAGCHGSTAAGSPEVDGGEYRIPIGSGGELYAYPAPSLNDESGDGGPSLAADPTWTAALLGMAAQSDMDNNGVSLRVPMPRFFMAMDDKGKPMGAQDFADIYAWLKTQTH